MWERWLLAGLVMAGILFIISLASTGMCLIVSSLTPGFSMKNICTTLLRRCGSLIGTMADWRNIRLILWWGLLPGLSVQRAMVRLSAVSGKAVPLGAMWQRLRGIMRILLIN